MKAFRKDIEKEGKLFLKQQGNQLLQFSKFFRKCIYGNAYVVLWPPLGHIYHNVDGNY